MGEGALTLVRCLTQSIQMQECVRQKPFLKVCGFGCARTVSSAFQND